MWSIAVAAILERPQRELIFVVAARKLQSLYMHAALCRLALFPNVTIIPIVSEPQNVSTAIRSRTADRSFAESVAERRRLHLRCARHDRKGGGDRKSRRRQDVTRIPSCRARPAGQTTLMARLSGWLDNQSRSPAMLRSAPKPAQAN